MKTFGEKDPYLNYYTRPGAYLIAIEEDSVILVETPKGYFLPGGGLDADETHEECIRRECLEELGYTVTVREKLAEVLASGENLDLDGPKMRKPDKKADGTKEKSKLGANSVLAVSMACARAAASSCEQPLFRLLHYSS